MRFNRLVIEAGQAQVSLALHDRLTVVAGAPPELRALLIQELIGGLDGGRSGLRLDLTTAAGHDIAVHRPSNGSHRVLDITLGTDVTEEHQGPDGRVDLLGAYGVDRRRARDLLHLDRVKLERDAGTDERIVRLADLDQTQLWSTAARVRLTDEELQELNATLGAAPTDPDLIADIEKHHHTLEAAIELHRRLSRQAGLVALFSFVAALLLTSVNTSMPIPVLAIGAISLLLMLLYWARIAKIQRSEQAALNAAGANSYLGFTVQRVDGMFNDTEQRRRQSALAEDHRSAAIRWTRLAGDVSVDWAVEHHDQIEAAAQLRRQLRSLSRVSTSAPELDERTADLAHSLVTHLVRLRDVGTAGEGFPLVLEDPFTDLPPATRLSLLELLARSSGEPQVILLTDQDDVASWARLEALTGEVALVEPHTEPREATPGLVEDLGPDHRADDLAV